MVKKFEKLEILWSQALTFQTSSDPTNFICLDYQATQVDECPILQSLPQELLQQHQEEAERDVAKAREHTEPDRKKGFGKTEDAVIELDQLHKHAVPRWKYDL